MSRPLILIVDDYEDGRDLYAEYFQFRGFQVITACDGAEAVAAARARAPDLILMDLRMPTMSGTEALRLLRTEPAFNAVPIVALTAHALKDERTEAIMNGFDEVLSKPCLPEDVVIAVERLLATPRHAI